MLSEKFISELTKLAAEQTTYDLIEQSNGADSVYDFCGGNYDDALARGIGDGEIIMARRVLRELGQWPVLRQGPVL